MKAIFLQKKIWISLVVLVLMAGGFGLISLVREAYTGPLHCQSCHPVQTVQWMSSGPHSTETQCSDCHASWPHMLPKRINLFKQYRDAVLPNDVTARDEGISANCMQCHEEVLGGAHATSRIVVMSHRIHLEEEMLCVDCHRNISHDTMSGQTYRPPKRVCYQCHLRDIDVGSERDESCLNCHRIILSREKSPQHF